MKILTISDAVSQELLDAAGKDKSLADVALILSCGDLPPEYLATLRHALDAPLMYVLGNHDLRYGSSPPAGCTCIDRRLIEFRGLRLLGLSGSRWYNGGMNQFTEKEMARSIRRMRFMLWRKGAPDIVVTHAPPRHVNDAEDPCHKGFRVYGKLIERYSPGYLIHGHIHRFFKQESDRTTMVKNTRVINSYGFHILEV